jgi:hypothetical protein
VTFLNLSPSYIFAGNKNKALSKRSCKAYVKGSVNFLPLLNEIMQCSLKITKYSIRVSRYSPWVRDSEGPKKFPSTKTPRFAQGWEKGVAQKHRRILTVGLPWKAKLCLRSLSLVRNDKMTPECADPATHLSLRVSSRFRAQRNQTRRGRSRAPASSTGSEIRHVRPARGTREEALVHPALLGSLFAHA